MQILSLSKLPQCHEYLGFCVIYRSCCKRNCALRYHYHLPLQQQLKNPIKRFCFFYHIPPFSTEKNHSYTIGFVKIHLYDFKVFLTQLNSKSTLYDNKYPKIA